MKNIIKLSVTLVIMMLSAMVSSAQIDNLTNLSPEWVRTGARNAATDAPDAAVYNPAGMSRLSRGVHISIGNQSLFRKPVHEYDLGFGKGMQSSGQNGADLFLPSLYASYNTSQMAFYTGVYFSGGGATANYPGGSINTDMIAMMSLMAAQGAYTDVKNQNLKASSAYLTTIAGISYGVSEKFSLGFTARYITAKNSTKAGLTMYSSPYELPDADLGIDIDETAQGFGGMFSMMVSPNQNLNLTARFETRVRLNFETKQNQDDFGISADGAESRRDLPAAFGLGLSYNLSPKVKALVDYNYYFQRNADWGTGYVLGEEKEFSEMAGNAATYALAFEYRVTPKFVVSAGSVYSEYSYLYKDGYFTKPGAFETLIDDNISINTGFSYEISDLIKINAGYMANFFTGDEVKALNAYPMDISVSTKNKMSTIALGLNLNF
jgi:long-chain fatty acid transport protein